MFSDPLLPTGVPWTVLGLMSGISADGPDAALIRVDPAGFQGGSPFLAFLGHRHEPYGPKLRRALLGAASAAGVPGNLPEVTGASRPAVLGSWVGG